MPILSIIMPVFNERNTIREILALLECLDLGEFQKEIIVIDDGSTDGSKEILEKEFSFKYKILFHDKNRGKGAAIRTGLKHAIGDFFIIQDADLEYDPQNIKQLLSHLYTNQYDIVYGSRVLNAGKKEYSSYLFHIGGLLITWWTNLLYKTELTDEATCFKLFTRKVLNSINLTCNGFDFCPEFTGKILNSGYKIHEIGISYHPRSRKNGKKIKIHDGLLAFWTLFKIKLLKKT